jgi:hypothetical protein
MQTAFWLSGLFRKGVMYAAIMSRLFQAAREPYASTYLLIAEILQRQEIVPQHR